MTPAMTGVFIGLIAALLLFVSGYATLLLPKEKAVAMPIAGRINQAFGPDETFRFVRFMGLFLMIVGVCFIFASLVAFLNNISLFV
jgi:uncharacterized membrane protein